MIRIARGLSLPLDAVTQTIGILARKRAGKSYTARRLSEQLFKGGQQVVLVDPKGDHWGIRSAADGKTPGLPIVIIGGERGDVPLEPSGGEVVAKLVVEERVSALLDLSLLRKHEVATFMTAFLEGLYRLKAREVYRTPVMLVIDEADAIAPQKPQPNEARMLGAAEDIVRRGGQRGIGCTMITQRSAVLAKDVLTQIQMLIVLRTIAPQDLKAVREWIDVHGTPEQGRELIESLPALPKGDAWFWSPGWPDVDGIFQRAKVLPIETFDSGATPKPGEKRVEPKHLADVDLDALRRQMNDTIERQKADDPKLLRKQIAELQKAARDGAGSLRVAQLERELEEEKARPRKEVVVIHEKDVKAFEAACAKMKKALDEHIEELKPMQERLSAVTSNVLSKLDEAMRQGQIAARAVSRPTVVAPKRTVSPPAPTREPSEGVSGPQQRMLDALAAFEVIGQSTLTRGNLAVFSNQSSRSSGYEKNLSTLRSGGLIDYPSSSHVRLTDAGRAKANADGAPATLAALHEAWRRMLSGPQVRMVDALIRVYPAALTREDLAAESNQSSTSSGYEKNLSTLRSLGVSDYPERGSVVATDVLFPAGLT